MIEVLAHSGEFWTNFGEAIAPSVTTVFTFLLGVVSHRLTTTKKKPHISVAETYEFNLKISVATEVCLALMGPNAMRVYYSKYHNGETFDDGSSIQKKSRVCEALRNGVAPIPDKYATLLVSRVVDELTLVKADGPSYTYTDTLPNRTFRRLCEDTGAQAVARAGVYKGKRVPENLIGFVAVDFDGDNVNHRPDPPASIAQLVILAEKIGQLAQEYRT